MFLSEIFHKSITMTFFGFSLILTHLLVISEHIRCPFCPLFICLTAFEDCVRVLSVYTLLPYLFLFIYLMLTVCIALFILPPIDNEVAANKRRERDVAD